MFRAGLAHEFQCCWRKPARDTLQIPDLIARKPWARRQVIGRIGLEGRSPSHHLTTCTIDHLHTIVAHTMRAHLRIDPTTSDAPPNAHSWILAPRSSIIFFAADPHALESLRSFQ